MTPDVLVEGFLFYKSSPQKKLVIQKLFTLTPEELANAVAQLRSRLTGGVCLIETPEELQLATAPALAPIIETLRKNELKADIGKAGAETLAIVLYKGPVSRTDIDAIRGVNSSFILRNLMIRGLVERIHNKTRNAYEFVITPSLLSHLGVTHSHELPQFSAIMNALEEFNAGHTAQDIPPMVDTDEDDETVTL